jgi:hypothetical protein
MPMLGARSTDDLELVVVRQGGEGVGDVGAAERSLPRSRAAMASTWRR